MIQLFRSVIDRVKAMFTLDAMLDLEQQFASRHAERKAELMRTADRYEREGLTAIAAELRCRADTMSEQRPLETVVPFLKDHSASRPASSAPRGLEDRRERRPKLPLPAATSQRKKGK